MAVTWKKLAYEDDVVTKALYDAYTILRADTDNIPTALTVGASTIVGRKAAGGIVALTAAEVLTIINVAAGATAVAKISAATLETGTDDVGFVTALSIHSAAQHQIPHAAPGAAGNMLQSDGTDWLSVTHPAPASHALSAHSAAAANIALAGYQATDQVLQTVANVAAVNAYATPVVGKILWSTAELSAYICTVAV